MTDEQNSAGVGAKRGRAATPLLAVTGLILILVLVFPGFLAVGFTKVGGGILCEESLGLREGDYWWSDRYGPRAGTYRVAGIVLFPSVWLMNHSAPFRRFYMWEYHLAGGEEAVFAD